MIIGQNKDIDHMLDEIMVWLILWCNGDRKLGDECWNGFGVNKKSGKMLVMGECQ